MHLTALPHNAFTTRVQHSQLCTQLMPLPLTLYFDLTLFCLDLSCWSACGNGLQCWFKGQCIHNMSSVYGLIWNLHLWAVQKELVYRGGKSNIRCSLTTDGALDGALAFIFLFSFIFFVFPSFCCLSLIVFCMFAPKLSFYVFICCSTHLTRLRFCAVVQRFYHSYDT